MRNRLARVILMAVVCAAAGSPAWAQTPEVQAIPPDADQQTATQSPPAHVELVDGVATLEHQGQSDRASMSQPLVPGDRLRTERGRVEAVFADGSFLYLDEFTSLEFLSESLFRLTQGRATLIVKGQADTSAASARYQIDTPAASVRTDEAGEYRVATLSGRGSPETELAVVRGVAQLATDAGAMIVRAGERSTALDNVAPASPQPFNSARFDAFDRWTASRQDAWLGSTSTRYLPQDVQMYSSTFDRYGAWDTDPQYGNVWYPTVAPGWRPYYNGYWDYYPSSYGWFWIGTDPWVWPTHHWGRWGYARSRWFWIPQRRWGSAWVSWAISPGYVSWCPLGFDGRPVVGFFGVRASFGYDPWHAWTVIPRRSFGTRVHVNAAFVDGRRIAPAERGSFIAMSRAPQGPPRTPYAVPRGSATGQPAFGGNAASSTGRRFDRGVVDPRGAAAARPSPSIGTRRSQAVVGAAVPRGNPTRIDPGGGGPRSYGPAYGYGSRTPQPQESPYDRASRVAGERRPGVERQPLPQGDTSHDSPYPPQYRTTVPEPYRPRSNQGYQYGWPSAPVNRAVPRGYSQPPSPTVVRPPGGARSYPAPYSPTVVEPRRGGPDRGPGPGRSPQASPRGGGNRGTQAAPPSGQSRQSAQPRQGGGGGGSSRRRGGG